MPKWLEIYLNWWGSQTEKLIEMTLIDFVVSIPLAISPLVLLYWFIGGLKKADDIANQKETKE